MFLLFFCHLLLGGGVELKQTERAYSLDPPFVTGTPPVESLGSWKRYGGVAAFSNAVYLTPAPSVSGSMRSEPVDFFAWEVELSFLVSQAVESPTDTYCLSFWFTDKDMPYGNLCGQAPIPSDGFGVVLQRMTSGRSVIFGVNAKNLKPGFFGDPMGACDADFTHRSGVLAPGQASVLKVTFLDGALQVYTSLHTSFPNRKYHNCFIARPDFVPSLEKKYHFNIGATNGVNGTQNYLFSFSAMSVGTPSQRKYMNDDWLKLGEQLGKMLSAQTDFKSSLTEIFEEFSTEIDDWETKIRDNVNNVKKETDQAQSKIDNYHNKLHTIHSSITALKQQLANTNEKLDTLQQDIITAHQFQKGVSDDSMDYHQKVVQSFGEKETRVGWITIILVVQVVVTIIVVLFRMRKRETTRLLDD